MKPIHYDRMDNESQIYRQIRKEASAYFADNHLPRNATSYMAFKVAILVLLYIAGYASFNMVDSFAGAVGAFGILTFAALILSINLAHDAAHHAVTGNKKTDDHIFRSIFALQGISGYIWQVRHNSSHHLYPNVREYDSDLEMTKYILLDANPDAIRWYHQYQHIYAPLIYSMVSFYLLFIQDFKFFLTRSQANLMFRKTPLIEWVKMIFFKVLYFVITFGIPMMLTSVSISTLFFAWAIVHMGISVFTAFTFYISHHVKELNYVDSGKNKDTISDSWIHHQISTTIDFEPNNRFANFIFGGFNLHVAHHVFPEVSHQHYPALTKVIRKVLAENGASDWYQSASFLQACKSHLKHLRNTGRSNVFLESDELIATKDWEAC